MNAYELHIWANVKHDGKFSHNAERALIIHARSEAEAKGKVHLKKGYSKSIGMNLEVSDEIIYSVYKIGKVEIHPCYIYSNYDRTPQLVDTYKQYLKQYNKED